MKAIGLFGHEYDECIKLLKVRIEDLGHRAIVFNLMHVPRVTQVSIDSKSVIYDGYDLLGMDCCYLRDMEVRDPFFHVSYPKDLWAELMERYLNFASHEVDSIVFTRGILEIVASRVPVVNHPRIYSLRCLVPYQFDLLARRDFAVLPFVAGYADTGASLMYGEEVPVNRDEERTWDVLSFPKGQEKGLQITRKRCDGELYQVVIIGEQSLQHVLFHDSEQRAPRVIPLADVPEDVHGAARRAARATGARFALVEIRHDPRSGDVWLLQVDPSPDFHELETVQGIAVSQRLAEYLVGTAGEDS